MFKNLSLRVRFIIIGAIISVTSAVSWELYFMHRANIVLNNELSERANALLGNLAMNSTYGLLTSNRDELTRLACSTLQQKDIYAVRITNAQGVPIVDIRNTFRPWRVKEYTMSAMSEPPAATTDENIMFPFVKHAPQERIGTVTIAMSLDSMQRKMGRILRLTIIMIVLVLLAISFTVFITVRHYIVNPIRELIHATRVLSQGNMQYRISIERNDEMGTLAAFFNEMAAELQASKQKIEDYNSELEAKVQERTRELRESQQKLIQTSKMSGIGQLAGGVAHEINNPMTIILGFAQVVVKDMKEDHPMYLPLKSIEREAIRCKKLVADLLTFSRVAKAMKEPTDIAELIEHTLTMIEAQAKMKNVIIERDFDASAPHIPVNRNQIQQVIVNLCNNAIDAMPNGGKITITTRPAGQEIEMRISDSGTGMPDEVKQHIFEPFFTTKDVGKGTGLGLSLCYETITEKHSGTITVESDLGKGTTFIIRLPRGH